MCVCFVCGRDTGDFVLAKGPRLPVKKGIFCFGGVVVGLYLARSLKINKGTKIVDDVRQWRATVHNNLFHQWLKESKKSKE